MDFRANNRWLLLCLLLVTICLSFASGCIVNELNISGLPCGEKGKCSSGFKCYLVSGYGPLCLARGDEFSLFMVDASAEKEKPVEPSVVPDKEEPTTTKEKVEEPTTTKEKVEESINIKEKVEEPTTIPD